MLSETMITAYLERIGCADARTPSRENLFRLQRAHLATGKCCFLMWMRGKDV